MFTNIVHNLEILGTTDEPLMSRSHFIVNCKRVGVLLGIKRRIQKFLDFTDCLDLEVPDLLGERIPILFKKRF